MFDSTCSSEEVGVPTGKTTLRRRWRWMGQVTRPGKHTKNHGTSPFLIGKSIGKSMGKSIYKWMIVWGLALWLRTPSNGERWLMLIFPGAVERLQSVSSLLRLYIAVEDTFSDSPAEIHWWKALRNRVRGIIAKPCSKLIEMCIDLLDLLHRLPYLTLDAAPFACATSCP